MNINKKLKEAMIFETLKIIVGEFTLRNKKKLMMKKKR